jgi:hypothetical protein
VQRLWQNRGLRRRGSCGDGLPDLSGLPTILAIPESILKHDEIRMNHRFGLLFEHDLSENRFTVFRIMR